MEQEIKTTTTADNQDAQMAENAQETTSTTTDNTNPSSDSIAYAELVAENARIKAELSRQITKNDTLSTENKNLKNENRSYKSAEQIRDEERREAEEAKDARLKELEKKIAISEISKSLMTIVSDDARASKMAEWLHGAEDANSMILEFRKILDEQEKRLKVEFGKIPAPGIGGSDGPTYTKEQLDGMDFSERARFAAEHIDEYRKIMGR